MTDERDATEDLPSDPSAPSAAVLVDDGHEDGPAEFAIEEEPEREWEWVVRCRAEAAPTPWSAGLAVSAFTGLIVFAALVVLAQSLADVPVMAVGVCLVVGLGLLPAVWMVRTIPVVRWVGWGIVGGTLVGWIGAGVALTYALSAA